jgi:hypothetical protein
MSATSILTRAQPLLFAAACRIHGEAESFKVTRSTQFHLEYVEGNFMPYVPDVEGADGQQMGNLRMNVGFFIKHSMEKVA